MAFKGRDGHRIQPRQTSADTYVTCAGGILNGQWFTEQEWATRLQAHQRMRDAGSLRSRGAGDYNPTERTIDHPQIPAAIGRIHTYKWSA